MTNKGQPARKMSDCFDGWTKRVEDDDGWARFSLVEYTVFALDYMMGGSSRILRVLLSVLYFIPNRHRKWKKCSCAILRLIPSWQFYVVLFRRAGMRMRSNSLFLSICTLVTAPTEVRPLGRVNRMSVATKRILIESRTNSEED